MKNKFFEFYIENKNNYFYIKKEYKHYLICIYDKYERYINIDDFELNDNLELIVEKDKIWYKQSLESYKIIKPFIDNFLLKEKLESQLTTKNTEKRSKI